MSRLFQLLCCTVLLCGAASAQTPSVQSPGQDSLRQHEQIAIGYGTQEGKYITGAVGSLQGSELANIPTPNVMQALQGRLAGVQIMAQSGAPGAGMDINIRGWNTLPGVSPWYVVDGVLLQDISFLQPNDIASISVLKDDTSAAIYGARASNGVVLITTKEGSRGRPVLQVHSMQGVQQIWQKPDMLNSQEWYAVMRSVNKKFTLNELSNNVYNNTDWLGEISRMGRIQTHEASLSGGGDKLRYWVGGTYFDQEGTLKASYLKQLNGRMRIDGRMGRISYGASLSLQRRTSQFLPDGQYEGVLNTALRMPSISPVYRPDGQFMGSVYSDLKNPVAVISRWDSPNTTLQSVANVYVGVQLAKNLLLKSSLSSVWREHTK